MGEFSSSLFSLETREDINHLIQIIEGGDLVEGDGNVLVIDLSNVDAKLVELCLNVIGG